MNGSIFDAMGLYVECPKAFCHLPGVQGGHDRGREQHRTGEERAKGNHLREEQMLYGVRGGW